MNSDEIAQDIIEECKKKSLIYHCPLPRKTFRTMARGRSGKVKVYNEDEIQLFIRRKVKHELKLL